MSRPADCLEHIDLNNGWKVAKRVTKPAGATGGCFSVGYEAFDQTGRKGFLKAFDFDSAMGAHDPPAALLAMLKSYTWERELLAKCQAMNMHRIATPLTHGSIQAPGHTGFSALVYYFIFEWAEHKDLRQLLISLAAVDTHVALVSLRHASQGLLQLHQGKIYHQDLKPSNVVAFDRKEFKLGDLGRSTDAASPAAHDAFPCPGDTGHAPPEQLYPRTTPWTLDERKAGDLYQLGSLIFFNFTGLTARTWMHSILKAAGVSGGANFATDLPYLKAAFSKSLAELEAAIAHIESNSREMIQNMARELCEPDPRERGARKFRGRNGQYEIERYASRLAELVKRAELGMI